MPDGSEIKQLTTMQATPQLRRGHRESTWCLPALLLPHTRRKMNRDLVIDTFPAPEFLLLVEQQQERKTVLQSPATISSPQPYRRRSHVFSQRIQETQYVLAPLFALDVICLSALHNVAQRQCHCVCCCVATFTYPVRSPIPFVRVVVALKTRSSAVSGQANQQIKKKLIQLGHFDRLVT